MIRPLARGACLGAALTCACAGSRSVSTPRGRWILVATRRQTFILQLSGPPDRLDSDLVLSSDSAPVGAFGQAELSQPITPGKARRVRVAADVRPHNVRASAGLWVRADGDGRPILTEYAAIPARGSSGWQRQETGLVIPDSATAITYGVLLQGPGTVLMRHLTRVLTDIPSADAPLSPDARREVDSALTLAKTYALWRDTISWSTVDARVRRAAAGAQSVADVHPALRLLSRSLGDGHSSFYTPHDMQVFRSAANTPVIDVHLEERDIGNIYLSGYLAEDIDSARAYDERMHAAIDRVMPAAACGWIVDLRGNRGGVPEPMLVAIEPFVSRDSLPPVEREGIAAWFGQRSPMIRPALEKSYVALLIAAQTGSAGERTVLFLQRRAHTRTFGSPTAGATTRRSMFILPDGAAIGIATAPMRQGSSREMAGCIVPDEILPSDGTSGDPVLRAAARWLRGSLCAGQPGRSSSLVVRSSAAQRRSSMRARTLSSESRNSASQSSWSGMRAMTWGSPMKRTPRAARSLAVAWMSWTRK